VSSPDSFYITTPIYYVNGRPHIGHAYTTISADTATRYQRMKGKRAFFLTGTDEHGQKVLAKATERGMTPKEHADDMVTHWKAMWERLHIDYSHFIRTTDAEHITCVQAALQYLYDQGQMYSDTYEGWYSTSAERFWTEKDLIAGKCPETGQPVVRIEETNWFFKMSAYQEQLIAHIEANPGFIRPASRRNEVLGFLRQPLGDLCISRPKSRMGWGIEIPFDRDYVTYVWFDALLNYISHLGYVPGVTPPNDLWPADFQLIGKDILTTHAVYWSTMLLALGVPLPKALYAHGWWLAADGAKMSKSLNNAIDVGLIVDAFGVDAARYFFLREIRFGADGNFSYEGFLNRYNADLANDFGNLTHRGLTMTSKWLGGVVPEYSESTGHEDAIREVAQRAAKVFDEEIAGLQFNKALEGLWEIVQAGNKYIDTTEPWALNRDGKVEQLKTVMRTVLEISALAGSFLKAVLPTKSDELLAKLGITDPSAVVQAALEGNVLNALTPAGELTVGDPLFPRHREMPEQIAALMVVPEPPPKKAKKAKKPKAKEKKVSDTPETISFEDFMKVKLKTGTVVGAEAHPNADRLLVLSVDVGEESPRSIVAGIASKFSPEELMGRKVVVVANLKPAKLRGVLSEGMLLAAGDNEIIDLVHVDAEPGQTVR